MSQHINPTPKQTDVDSVNSKIGNVGSTDLQAQITALNSKTNYVYIEGQYSTILSVFNAYKTVMSFPFTVQKAGNAVYTDLPSDSLSACEWAILCYGTQMRTTILFTIFSGAGSGNGSTYIRNVFNGSYNTDWRQVI